MTVLALCLGNRIRRDDGVGWRVAAALRAAAPPGLEVRETALSGLHLLDEMEGFEEVVLVDAVASGRAEPGTVRDFPLSDLPATASPTPHGLGLPTAVRAAAAMGAPVPRALHVVTVEVADMTTLGEGLTAAVEAAVPEAVARVLEVLVRWRDAAGTR
ncbi:hydrogenase maturation protease [Anaeromyxobacter paludicola]|uniref:Hydrogenase maturation protease n=1 Tax=Anaeromyxobacter paludicola TaxID=2918171 RepID=A0ABM7XDH4_9BACT|nr:hydrogenase maturation protease [Anaeromyxobacter paludicola]BDG09930.1 hypothetical protein AMPC_30430 [Anaeromyxobacter paludicola]